MGESRQPVQYNHHCDVLLLSEPLQVKLRNAARARLLRWVKPKSKRSDREAPELVKQQWATGNKNELADLLAMHNFDQDTLH